MAIRYEPENKNINTKEVTQPAFQPANKNSVDNEKPMVYNKEKSKYPMELPVHNWLKKNQDTMRYAGDSAKKSIDAGLKDAPDFMKDADEGTKFEDVQSAVVKRQLANDSNNADLAKKATMEIIGHLSKENKEPYLKHAEPLQTYIDAKDEFDYRHKNYTTTLDLDTTPDEKVRETQQKLNEKGYTDKFGEPLKEDGIYGAKTRYAKDNYEADNGYKPTSISDDSRYNISTLSYSGENTSQRFGNRMPLTSRSGNARAMNVANSAKSSYTYAQHKSGNIKYVKDYDVDPFPEPSKKKIQQGEDVIKRNKDNIINAGREYGVNPAILAACIYTEQTQNVDFFDTLTDNPLYFADTSIGVGQVKSSTAKMLEEAGYIEPLKQVGTVQDWHAQSFSTKPLWYIPGYGDYPGTEAEARACRLAVESESVNYVAAYLKYFQDRWSKYYKNIDGDTAILASLFNLGHNKQPHANPKPNPFGMTARNSYYHMIELLELD